ncbi:MAG: hypothetical protein AAGM84_03525 [Pseudomonadota bacterium]
MIKLKYLALGCAGLSLAACAELTPVTTPPQAVSFTSSQAQQNIHSMEPITIRTLQPGNGGTLGDEVIGASCRLRGTGYTVDFVTPADVTLPTYLGRTDPVNVTCRANGATATERFNAINQRTQSSPVSGPIVAVLIVAAAEAAIRASRDPSKDTFAYAPTLFVEFENNVAAPAE